MLPISPYTLLSETDDQKPHIEEIGFLEFFTATQLAQTRLNKRGQEMVVTALNSLRKFNYASDVVCGCKSQKGFGSKFTLCEAWGKQTTLYPKEYFRLQKKLIQKHPALYTSLEIKLTRHCKILLSDSQKVTMKNLKDLRDAINTFKLSKDKLQCILDINENFSSIFRSEKFANHHYVRTLNILTFLYLSVTRICVPPNLYLPINQESKLIKNNEKLKPTAYKVYLIYHCCVAIHLIILGRPNLN